MDHNLEVGDIVMCTVERIVGILVFVKIDRNGEGSIILSEIAPGRIRNLRNYVVPKKRIVCKVLRITGDRIDLSLRRVTPKEQKEIKEKEKQEKSYKSILKTVLGEKTKEITQKLSEDQSLYETMEEIKENPKKLEKLVGKTDTKKILDILQTQKQKKRIIQKQISLTSTRPDGLELIKKILGKIKDAEVKYISAGQYSIKTESTDAKKADNKAKEILEEVEKQAKKIEMEFSIKGK